MQKWVGYAQKLDQEGTHPATAFFDEVYVELAFVKQHHGNEIARQLFDAGHSFTFNPFEIRGAARFLKEGMTIENVCQKALDGFCDQTRQERLESQNMLNALKNPRYATQNTSTEQNPKALLDEQLEAFCSDQARLIREIVDKTVLDAVAGAEVDEDEKNMYCEIDLDIVNDRLSQLYDMGTSLTVEKLSEFIDAHPAINYSDVHNTGITIYLNSPEILQTLGLLPTNGIMDMQI